MVKCIICGLVILFKNRGIGSITLKRIADHYIEKHSINPTREPLIDYLRSLMDVNYVEFIPLACPCSPVLYLTMKDFAIHQLREGCDLDLDDGSDQVGGAKVSVFENDNQLASRFNRSREKIISDEEVDDYYTFSVQKTNVESVNMYNLKYTRKIETITLHDAVIPPLAFLSHAVENIRKFTQKNNLLKEGGEWIHGKMQLVVAINYTQNNTFIITSKDHVEEDLAQPIGPELTFVASPLNVTLMSFNNVLPQQQATLENKLLEAQQNGSGWTLHSIAYVDFLLVLNPRNISSVGLRKLVGGTDNQFDMDQWTLNEVEVEGDESEDEDENGVNEYDKNDSFVNDEETDNSNVSFYLNQNSKRRREFDGEQAGPSKKKSKLEAVIENYVQMNDVIVSCEDADGQIERNNLYKGGNKGKSLQTIAAEAENSYDGFDDVEEEEGAELNDFNRGIRKVKKDYTDYLKDYSVYDAFIPLTDNSKSKDFRISNLYRRKRLTHCILKAILGAIHAKKI